MARPPRDLPGIAGCAVLIGVAILAIVYSSDFTPLGSVFPRTIAAAMILFCGLYIVLAITRPGPPKPVEAGSAWRRAVLFAVMVGWAIALEKVGFLATSVVAFVAILLAANYDRWTARRSVGYAIASALILGGLYAVFRFVLQVPLPEGMLL
jgi:putative tricarboxylic transport membrane protein